MKIIVTGGCGYIGSHLIIELLKLRHEIICIDNLSNSSKDILDYISALGGGNVMFYEEDLRDYVGIEDIFDENRDIDCVIHLAGTKSVEESVKFPLVYYDNNVHGTMNLLFLMKRYKINRLIFSSSACVYGKVVDLPIKITHPTNPENPYGNSKLAAEKMIFDHMNSYGGSAVILRYFNPCGAHDSGKIGENPKGMGNNLFPRIANFIRGKLDHIGIFGDNYVTPDGTAVRDYIHIMDLVKAHICALNNGFKNGKSFIYNIGSGKGYSVKEIIGEFERQLDSKIKTIVESRREGDVAELYTDPGNSLRKLKWECELGLDKMVESTIKMINNSS